MSQLTTYDLTYGFPLRRPGKAATLRRMNTPVGSTAQAKTNPPQRRADRKLKPVARSRVGNGKVLLSGIDTHSVAYREYRDVVSDLVEHMGSAPTVVQRAIIEEAAGLIVWCRSARLGLLLGGDGFNVGQYTTATNALRRLLGDIGQEAKLKDVTPQTLDDIAAEIHAEEAAATLEPAQEKSTIDEPLKSEAEHG